MPVTTVRYSAALEQTYEEEEEASTDGPKSEGRTPSSTTQSPMSSSSSSSSSCGDPPTNIDGGGSGEHSRQASVDGTEFIPTRTVKASTAGRPAFNPLQFVKTGACNVVYKKTEQQGRQYDDVRKVKEMVKEEEEAWQSNLDNWKSKRRQISHHTIQRAEEIKQIQEIEHDRQRKKSKTFTEIMQDRSKRRASSSKLPVYRGGGDDDGEADDASDAVWTDNDHDNGWSSDRGGCGGTVRQRMTADGDRHEHSKLDASFESSGSDGVFRDDDLAAATFDDDNNGKLSAEPIGGLSLEGQNNDESARSDILIDASSLVRNTSSSDDRQKPSSANCSSNNQQKTAEHEEGKEEYTFEKAIRSYVEFAESRTLSAQKLTSTPSTSSTLHVNSSGGGGGGSTSTNNEAIPEQRPRQHDDLSAAEKGDIAVPQKQRNQERPDGKELSIVVCLKRGGESKDFGFATKTVTGVVGYENNVFVESVAQGGAADVSGLRVDDELLAINGECTSNRSHSAIVFAVKQAVYTGRLELQIYRHSHTGFLHRPPSHLSISSSSSSSSTPTNIVTASKNSVDAIDKVRRRGGPGTGGGNEQQSPVMSKVVTKRRSMFEAGNAKVDKSLHRRSLDFSGGSAPRVRDKLASFENLDLDRFGGGDRARSPGYQPRRTITPERDATFERKLASFKSMDSLDDQCALSKDASRGGRPSPSSPNRTLDRVGVSCRGSQEAFRKKLSSFENLRQQSFERTRSCDFLNDVGCTDDVLDRREARAGHDDDHENDDDDDDDDDDDEDKEQHGRDSFSPDGKHFGDVAPDRKSQTVIDSTVADHAADDGGRSNTTPMASHAAESHHSLDDDSSSSQKNIKEKSGFALAMDLQETPITGSRSSSPTPSIHDDRVPISTPNQSHIQTDTFDSDASMVGDEEDFDLTRPSTLEPPKEKPPPPPIDTDRTSSAAAAATTTTAAAVNVKRMSSTKRIRKEICRRRSDFLGIEADEARSNRNQEYENLDTEQTECCVIVDSSPKVNVLLQTVDQQVDAIDVDTANSPATVTSTSKLEEDEMTRKEREIIEDLEREEEQRQRSSAVSPAIVAAAARTGAVDDDVARLDMERKLRERDEKLRRQEEILQREKEKLRLEQERLLREKEAYQKQINEHHRVGNGEDCRTLDDPEQQVINVVSTNKPRLASPASPSPTSPTPPPLPPTKPKIKSPPNASPLHPRDIDRVASKAPPSEHHLMDDPPMVRSNGRESAFSPSSASTGSATTSSRSSSKQMIHVLSASPRAKLKDSEQWLAEQSCRNATASASSNVHVVHERNSTDCNNGYNRQHWLVQEAEMRRLIQQQDRESNNKNNNINMKHINNDRVNQNGDRVASSAQRQPLVGDCSRTGPPTLASASVQYADPTNTTAVADRLNGPPPPPPPSHRSPQNAPPSQHGHHEQSVGNMATSRNTFQHGPLQAHFGRPVHGSGDAPTAPPPPPPPPPPALHLQRSSPSSSAATGGHVPLAVNDTVLSVSGKKKCSHCSQELGRGAAMIIESLHLFYHIECFKCCVCHVQLGNGTSGADVRVRNHKLHCHNCYSNDEGLKFSKV